MAREAVDIRDSWRCTGNGAWRIDHAAGSSGRLTISAMWESAGITPAGKAIFSVDGDPGINNLMDLANDRIGVCNGCPAFVDVDVQGLPDGGVFTLYFR